MFRPMLLLCHHAGCPVRRAVLGRFGIGYKQPLLLATLFALIVAAPSVCGQSESSSAAGAQASPKPEICEGVTQSDTHRLSLATSRPRSLESGAGEAEEQASAQESSESKSKDVGLPELDRSSAEAQQPGVFCPRPKSGTDAAASAGPAPEPAASVAAKDNQDASTVSYADGNLTISAQNERLEDVIKTIRAETGITVEFPPQGMSARVFDHVGPSPLREALVELLYGTGYNYIIKTSSQDPQAVTGLILSAQAHGAAPAMARQASELAAEEAEAPTAYGAAGYRYEGPPEIIQPATAAASNPSPGAAVVPGVPPGFNVQQAAAAAQKTPGQILDELQKQQLQTLDSQNPQP